MRIHASVGNIVLEDRVVDLDIRYGNVKPQTAGQSEPLTPETIVVLCSPGVREGPPPIYRLRSRTRIRKIKVFREWLLQELETEPAEAFEIPANV